MTMIKASAILIVLAMVSLMSAYPVGSPQTAEHKGRGRSYPLIISHYSNVRNSKYNAPPATEAPTTAAAVLNESDDLKLKTNEEDDTDIGASAAGDEAKRNDQDETVKDEADEKSEKDDIAAATADSAANVPKSESISVVAAPAVEAHTPDDSSLLIPKKAAVPSNEKIEVAEQTQEPTLSEGSAAKESDATGTALTDVQEEVRPTQKTTSLIEADKPAALGESETSGQQVNGDPEMDMANTTNATAAAAAAAPDSVAKVAEPPAEVVQEEAKTSESMSEQVKAEDAASELSARTPEPATPVESSRTAVLATDKEKTGEFFEEDRSFKDRPEPELILAAIRQSAAAALGVGDGQKVLPAQIDDVANEGIRLQRDDNKKTADKKEKEKEKYSAKPTKEKKPVKQTQSIDPVQEYDDVVTRSGKSNDDAESTTDKALTADEPVTVGQVPSNYPVILPDGGSALSHQIASSESPKEVIEPITTSLTPTNYPVISPSGESTLSDKIAQDETKSLASEEPVIISLVPSNYPVILPSGESTLSDKVKPEDLESPKAAAGEK